MAERRRHKKRIQVVKASPGVGDFRALGSRRSEGSPWKGERNRGRHKLGFRCEVSGCGLRRCEGPGGGAVLATEESEADVVGQRRKAKGAAWSRPRRRGCQRRVSVTAPAQACAERSASSRAQTPTSPGSSPPFSASFSRLSYPEIKAMVIRVEGDGGLVDLKQPVLCAQINRRNVGEGVIWVRSAAPGPGRRSAYPDVQLRIPSFLFNVINLIAQSKLSGSFRRYSVNKHNLVGTAATWSCRNLSHASVLAS